MKRNVQNIIIFLFLISSLACHTSELNSHEEKNTSRENRLLNSSRWGLYSQVHQLLKEKTNVNVTWKSDWTPLMEAADSGHENILTLLIRYTADIDYQDQEKYTALIYTVYTGDPTRKNGKPGEETKKLAYTLLRAGADYTIRGTDDLYYLNLLKELKITDKEKEFMIKESKDIVQNRWNTICLKLDENNIPGDIIGYFFSYLYDVINDSLCIDKRQYLKEIRKGTICSIFY